MRMSKILPLIVSLAILIILIYFSGPQKVLSLMLRANIYYLFFGFLLWLISSLLRTVRWKILLKEVRCDVNFFTAYKVLLAGLSISNLTPGKIGEPARAYFLKRVSGKRMSSVLPSLFVERMLDFIVTTMLAFFSIFLFANTPYFNYFILGLGIYFFVFSFGIFILLSEKRTVKILNLPFRFFSFIPKICRKKKEILSFSKNLHKSFVKYKRKSPLLYTFIMTLFIWILESLVMFFALLSLELYISPVLVITLVPLATLLSVLTFLPGGLGSGEALVVMLFSFVSALAVHELTASVLLARIVSFWPCVMIGMFFVLRIQRK